MIRRSFQNFIDVSFPDDNRRHSDIQLKTSDHQDESDGATSSKKGFSRLRRNFSRGSKDNLSPRHSSQPKLNDGSPKVIKRSASKNVSKDSLPPRYKPVAQPNDNDRVVKVMTWLFS